MDYKIYITKDAHNDLNDITTYIKNKLCNPTAALDFLSEIEKNYEMITKNPLMFALCIDSRLKNEGYRKIIVKNYIVFYKINENEKAIYIMRVIYGRRDYCKLI